MMPSPLEVSSHSILIKELHDNSTLPGWWSGGVWWVEVWDYTQKSKLNIAECPLLLNVVDTLAPNLEPQHVSIEASLVHLVQLLISPLTDGGNLHVVHSDRSVWRL